MKEGIKENIGAAFLDFMNKLVESDLDMLRAHGFISHAERMENHKKTIAEHEGKAADHESKAADKSLSKEDRAYHKGMGKHHRNMVEYHKAQSERDAHYNKTTGDAKHRESRLAHDDNVHAKWHDVVKHREKIKVNSPTQAAEYEKEHGRAPKGWHKDKDGKFVSHSNTNI